MATYDDIIAYAPLATFLSNRDTVAQMPDIVRRAQTYITSRLDHDFFRRDLGEIDTNPVGVILKSAIGGDDLLEVRSVLLNQRGARLPLFPRDYNMLVTLWSDEPRGIPQYWCYNPSGDLQVFPEPGRPMTLSIAANIAEPVLSPQQQENRLSTEYPELMEQCVAMHVAMFNMDAQAAQVYSGQLGELLTAANGGISRQRRDETAQRPVETRNVMGS